LASHKAAFTRTWLSLLPRLSRTDDPARSLSVRALLVMHRGVMPHLTRPILLMDWVGGCVEYGA
jgi:U3 small nucleolar RNA-associated protein 19